MIRLFKLSTFCTFCHCGVLKRRSTLSVVIKTKSYRTCTCHISKSDSKEPKPTATSTGVRRGPHRSPKRSFSCASLHRFTTRITALPASRVDTNMTAACRSSSSSPAVTCASAVSISSSIGGLIATRGYATKAQTTRDYTREAPKRRAATSQRSKRRADSANGRCANGRRAPGGTDYRVRPDTHGRRLYGRPRRASRLNTSTRHPTERPDARAVSIFRRRALGRRARAARSPHSTAVATEITVVRCVVGDKWFCA